MLDCHKDSRLESLLYKNVRITLFDGDIKEGLLTRAVYKNGYALTMTCNDLYTQDNYLSPNAVLTFYKSHVKNIEEV